MFSFSFGQKFDVNPPTPLFRGQNQFFLGDVFIFCLDFFDMLNGSSRCKAICAPFFLGVCTQKLTEIEHLPSPNLTTSGCGLCARRCVLHASPTNPPGMCKDEPVHETNNYCSM